MSPMKTVSAGRLPQAVRARRKMRGSGFSTPTTCESMTAVKCGASPRAGVGYDPQRVAARAQLLQDRRRVVVQHAPDAGPPVLLHEGAADRLDDGGRHRERLHDGFEIGRLAAGVAAVAARPQLGVDRGLAVVLGRRHLLGPYRVPVRRDHLGDEGVIEVVERVAEIEEDGRDAGG
jgi:hypothetical protein